MYMYMYIYIYIYFFFFKGLGYNIEVAGVCPSCLRFDSQYFIPSISFLLTTRRLCSDAHGWSGIPCLHRLCEVGKGHHRDHIRRHWQ